MRKTWIGKIMLFACCLLMCTRITYAAGDDTDGTELQVAQPVVLQIQLGQQWAGTEFQLKTNAGLYPGTITVGQDGILRTELGSSGTYILSCVNSGVTVLHPDDTPSLQSRMTWQLMRTISPRAQRIRNPSTIQLAEFLSCILFSSAAGFSLHWAPCLPCAL